MACLNLCLYIETLDSNIYSPFRSGRNRKCTAQCVTFICCPNRASSLSLEVFGWWNSGMFTEGSDIKTFDNDVSESKSQTSGVC